MISLNSESYDFYVTFGVLYSATCERTVPTSSRKDAFSCLFCLVTEQHLTSSPSFLPLNHKSLVLEDKALELEDRFPLPFDSKLFKYARILQCPRSFCKVNKISLFLISVGINGFYCQRLL